MNLRINADALRFRLSAEDFTVLCRESLLQDSTPLHETLAINFRILCAPLPEPSTCNHLHLASHSDAHGIFLTLTVTPEALTQLDADAPNKDGIRDFKTLADGRILTLDLAIDLHSRNKT